MNWQEIQLGKRVLQIDHINQRTCKQEKTMQWKTTEAEIGVLNQWREAEDNAWIWGGEEVSKKGDYQLCFRRPQWENMTITKSESEEATVTRRESARVWVNFLSEKKRQLKKNS